MTDNTNIVKGAETLKVLLTDAEKVEFSRDGKRVKVFDCSLEYGKGTIQYSKTMNTIRFHRKIILDKVTDFYIKHFPESNSVLYRIERGNEQIRGYVFLSSLVSE